MEDKENHDKKVCGKKTKQQITIPFEWEEKPGAPKKDWVPKRESFDHVPLSVKYIASVPFKWEEIPGTPLQCFTKESTKQETQERVLENRNLPLPPAYFSKYESDGGDSSYGDDYDEHDWMSELDFDAISVQSEESFCSAPSLLANRLTPLRNPYIEQQNDGSEAPWSPENNSSPNYATKNTSLKGAAFLAHLFPLYPPKSAFLEPWKNTWESSSLIE